MHETTRFTVGSSPSSSSSINLSERGLLPCPCAKEKTARKETNELLSWREGEKGVCFLQPVISFERCCALFGAESVAFQPPIFQDVTANLSVFSNNRDLYLRTVSLVCILVIFRFSRLLGIICLSHPRCRSHDKNSHAYNATITANRAGNSRVKLWVITLRGSSSPAVVIFFFHL